MGEQPPQDPPSWFLKFSNTLDSISKDVQSIRSEIHEISETANFAANQAKLAIKCTEATDKRVGELNRENLLLKNSVAELNAKLLNIECQSRRNNLIFSGIHESKENESWDACEAKLRDYLECVQLKGVSFERVHRIGIKNIMSDSSKPRDIIAKFTLFKEREKVWLSRFTLSKEKNIWISEDFPDVVESKRRTLLPALRAAQRSPFVKHASLRVDKLVLDKKTYTVETMSDLPPYLQPDKTSVVESDESVVFFTKHAIFSNLHSLPIVIDGQTYACNEQYFQSTKALHFGDREIADQIMKETDPYEMMNLAKKIKNFKHPEWIKQAEEVLTKAHAAKYRQNPIARQALIKTGQKRLGEASSNAFYGTGVGLFAKNPTDFSKWTGKNIMGKILTQIRDSLVET